MYIAWGAEPPTLKAQTAYHHAILRIHRNPLAYRLSDKFHSCIIIVNKNEKTKPFVHVI